MDQATHQIFNLKVDGPYRRNPRPVNGSGGISRTIGGISFQILLIFMEIISVRKICSGSSLQIYLDLQT
jgi:hypothetical protein